MELSAWTPDHCSRAAFKVRRVVPENRVSILVNPRPHLLVPILTGPTASGKTAFALELSERYELEIINADSLLVYREFDIGTAKPAKEELNRVAHHLIDIRDPEELYTAADFVRDVERLAREIHSRRKRALIVGGTPFYLKALTFGLWEAPSTNPEFRKTVENDPTPLLFEQLQSLDPTHAAKVGPADRYRIIRSLEILQFSGRMPSELDADAKKRGADPRFPLWVMDRAPAELESRIHRRTRAMLDQGFIDEAQQLRDNHPTARALGSVGYAQVLDHLDGKKPPGRTLRPGIDGLTDEIELATRQLVKAQRTFLRGMAHAQWFLFEQDRPKLEALAQETFQAATGES
jgi:tRNA dimethylallyltransferase